MTNRSAADPVWTRRLLWIFIAAYLLAMGTWAFSAGMRLRDDIWSGTRDLHFQGDISNSVNWGNTVLRQAETFAHSNAQNHRPLTIWQIMRGEDKYYKQLSFGQSEGFGLDYPPLRLLTMALWVRHFQEQFPRAACITLSRPATK